MCSWSLRLAGPWTLSGSPAGVSGERVRKEE
jgi:hypothetical protein